MDDKLQTAAILDALIVREGGYVDHPADLGGPTKFGITLGTLARWRAPQPVRAADVQALSEAEARAIYARLYIAEPGFDRIPDAKLRRLVVDCAVTSAPRQATLWLQTAAGTAADGILGPKTLAAIQTMDPGLLYRRTLALRLRFIGRLLRRNPSQAVFAEGWADRIAGFIET